MMRRRSAAISAILIQSAAAFWLGPADAQPANQSVGSAVAALAGLLVERGECTGIAVGTNHRGTQGFYAYGEVARGSGRLPTPATEFEIGSITKVFTTTLLAIYTQRQSIRFDAPLQNYLPRGITVPSFGARQITLVDLATHTSGLPRQPPMQGDSYSDAEMFAFLASYRLPRAPGTQFEYSNLGVALLAHALAQATGTPWPQMVQQEITAKLGMPDTRLKLDDEERARLAIGYNRAGQRTKENMPTWPAFNGAGALFSTASDMQRFLAWNMGEIKGALPNGLLDELHKSRFALPRPGAGVGLGLANRAARARFVSGLEERRNAGLQLLYRLRAGRPFRHRAVGELGALSGDARRLPNSRDPQRPSRRDQCAGGGELIRQGERAV